MDKRQAYSIYFSRTIYAVQWFILAPATMAIASEEHVSKGLIGFLPFAFIIGAATTQIPAALLSSKIGAKKTFLIGLLLLSIPDIIVAYTRSFPEALLLRVVAGLGAGLYFSPSASVLVNLDRDRSVTLLGFYNAAFSLGGLLGLSWGFLDSILGWRLATTLGGIIGIVAAIENLFSVGELKQKFIKKVSFNKKLFLLGVATSGIWGGSYVVGELMPSYASLVFKVNSYEVSPLISLYFLGNIVGGMFAYVFEGKDKVKSTFLLSFLTSITYPLFSLFNVYFMAFVSFLNGLFIDALFSVYYSIAVGLSNKSGESFSLSLINLINMLIGVWLSPIFSLSLSINIELPLYILLATTIIPVVLIKKV
ncbi:MAG: MFS transporter [Caldisphaeraceae archaeon]|nr:MFS transporter [Caldisphaeraceae archaeon]